MQVPQNPSQEEFLRLLGGEGRLFANFTYWMPDVNILNSLTLEFLDRAPHFPILKGFVGFWQKNLDGKLYSVEYDFEPHLSVRDFRHVSGEFFIN